MDGPARGGGLLTGGLTSVPAPVGGPGAPSDAPGPAASGGRRRRRTAGGDGIGAWWLLAAVVPVAFLLVFFAWPVGAMLWRGVSAEGVLDLGAFAEVLGRERTWRIVGQTLGMAAAGTVLAVALGLPAAFVLHRRAFPGRAALRAVITVPFVLPTVVVGVAFRALLAPGGPFGWTGLDQSTAAVVLAMVFFNVSVVVRQVGALWASLDPRQAEAARTLGSSGWRAFRTVTLPQLAPALASSAALVFLFCASAFGIVQTLGRPGAGTLESEIWVQTVVYFDLRTAAVFSTLQFLVVLTIVVFVHEFGHFIVARWCGVKVGMFSIGFGREIFGFTDKKGTRWRFAWIPLGGYVKFIDDENAASQPSADALERLSDADRSGAFQTKPLWQRAAVVDAGTMANIIRMA